MSLTSHWLQQSRHSNRGSLYLFAPMANFNAVAVGVPVKAIAQRQQIDSSRLNELVSCAVSAFAQELRNE